VKTVNCWQWSLHQVMFGALVCAALTGCGKESPYVPASGTVKFGDGTVPQGDISSISFHPKKGGPGAKGAQGTIEPDGSFEVYSERRGDGVKPGAYAVTVNAMVGYPQGKSVVPTPYTDPRATPLSAEVKASGENQFEFVLEKP